MRACLHKMPSLTQSKLKTHMKRESECVYGFINKSLTYGRGQVKLHICTARSRHFKDNE